MTLPAQICMGREQAEQIINALDVGMHLADRYSDTEDSEQIRHAYDELVAVVAEHSDLEDA